MTRKLYYAYVLGGYELGGHLSWAPLWLPDVGSPSMNKSEDIDALFEEILHLDDTLNAGNVIQILKELFVVFAVAIRTWY